MREGIGLKLQHVEIVVAIAEAGSLRRAAEALGRPQPSLTNSLRQIEDSLGLTLFRRSAKGTEPTPEALPIIEQARATYSQFARLKDTAAQTAGALSGRLTVAVSPFAAAKILPRALSSFRQRYPAVTVNLATGLFPSALEPLRAGRFDLLVGPVPDDMATDGLVIEPLLDTPRVLVTSARSPHAMARRIADLQEAPWTMIGPVGGPGDSFAPLYARHGLPVPTALTTAESLFGALALVRDLGAVCTFPQLLLNDVAPPGTFAVIPVAEPLDPIQIKLVRPAGRPLTPAGDYLLACIQRRAAALRAQDR